MQATDKKLRTSNRLAQKRVSKSKEADRHGMLEKQDVHRPRNGGSPFQNDCGILPSE